ncbi:MAG TPA: hypothetical protein VFJ61_04260 [Solirubrobacterales bacterium]|nr:hypothetical protein [Solirubrobacterales bacterium]
MGTGTSSPDLDRSVRQGDWRMVDSLYRQLAELKRSGRGSVSALSATTDRLAEAVAGVFASYEDCEEEFLLHLRDTMVRIDGISGSERERSRRLYKDESLKGFEAFKGGGRNTKPRPKPFEAAVETVQRITDLNRVRDKLEPLGTTAILGGSLSFGRFFTIYGSYTSERPSDIDLVLLVKHYQDIGGIAKALAEVKDGHGAYFIDRDQLEKMEERGKDFLALDSSDLPTIFQQKLDLWENADSKFFTSLGWPLHYRLAIHVLTLDDFDYITLKELARLSDLPEQPLRVRVYRDDEPSTETEDQFSFSGRHRTSPVEKDPEATGQVTMQVCELHEGRFYPGTHLNLMFPQFEVRWEDPELPARLPLQALRYKFQVQLEDERRLHPFEVQKLSFAHARSHQFARRVTQRLDSEWT